MEIDTSILEYDSTVLFISDSKLKIDNCIWKMILSEIRYNITFQYKTIFSCFP